MLSFWEKESFLNYDFIIIGSGIVGLSAAISIKERSPGSSVLVLERGLFPSGASTRNAGFACFGSLTEILSDIETTGADKTLAVVEKRIRGLARLRERLPDAVMDYQPVGGFELIFEKELPALQQIEKANELLKNSYPEGVYQNCPKLVTAFGFNKTKIKSIVKNPFEGHLHSGKLIQALVKLTGEKGIEIRTGAEVLEISETEKAVEVSVKEPVRGTLLFKAGKVAVCTNAFTDKFLPDLCITPGRGQVIITKPIPDLPWQGAFHFDEGYYYFRNVGNRVLFGGGRNLAFEQEKTTAFEPNEIILTELNRLLQETILPDTPFEIEQTWSGIMGFSEDKQPIIRKVSDRLAVGFSCNGMGVSLATVAGDEIAALLSD